MGQYFQKNPSNPYRGTILGWSHERFARYSGAIELDADDITRSSVSVSIDAASIETGVEDRDRHVRSADFFDVEKFPKVTFRSTAVERGDDTFFRMRGELTIRDVTRPVLLVVEYGGRATDPWGNERVGFAATLRINRKDFGLAWNQVLEAGGVLVGDRVDIDLDIQGVRFAKPDICG
ncbi:MAG: YceI family protein [Polyangiaceae bacterium]